LLFVEPELMSVNKNFSATAKVYYKLPNMRELALWSQKFFSSGISKNVLT